MSGSAAENRRKKRRTGKKRRRNKKKREGEKTERGGRGRPDRGIVHGRRPSAAGQVLERQCDMITTPVSEDMLGVRAY